MLLATCHEILSSSHPGIAAVIYQYHPYILPLSRSPILAHSPIFIVLPAAIAIITY